MKFSIARAAFVEGLKSVQNIVLSKTTIPVMQNVLLEASGDKLKMTTTDLDISIISTVFAQVDEPGSTTLPAKILFSMISCVAEGIIEVTVDENERASIRAGSAKFKLAGIPAENFPHLPVDEEAFGYAIEQATLKEMLRKTGYAAPQDDARRALKGVLMQFENGELTMVATDGRRLAMVTKELDFPETANQRVTLPTKSVTELQRALQNEGEAIVKIQNSQICFAMGSVVMYSKLLDEPYPNYRQVIPIANNFTVVVDRQQLVTALERVNVMTSDISSTNLNFSGNLLQISSSAGDIGEARDEVVIKYDGEDINITFNPVYLLDALKSIDDDEVKFLLRDGNSPAIIKCSIPFIYVIMPLKVS